MEDKLKSGENEENEEYEQFEIMEEEDDSNNKIHKRKLKSFLHPKAIITILLLTVSALLVLIIIFQIYSKINLNSSNSLEKKSESKNLESSNNDEIKYSIKAEYFTTKDDQNIKIIHTFPYPPMDLEIDGKKVGPTNNYTFAKKGNHIVYFYGSSNTHAKLFSTQTMFKGVRKLRSVSFSPLFNTKNVTSMRSMFQECVDLTSI
jgi:hypothetical protein